MYRPKDESLDTKCSPKFQTLPWINRLLIIISQVIGSIIQGGPKNGTVFVHLIISPNI